jgi:hypothetical protein
MLDAHGLDLRARLLELFAGPFTEPLADDAFNDTALTIFRYQFERNVPFAAFCRRRDRTPARVRHWTEIPAVPTAAFREVALVAGDPAAADIVFRTSGTTRGRERRGTHFVLDRSVYHASLLPNFAGRLLPDGAPVRMLSLLPPAEELSDSSLAHMITVVMKRFGAPGSRCVASVRNGIDFDGLAAALDVAEREGAPVCLLGTSFSFVHWMDHLDATGRSFTAPAGSRLMDTGGYKGRSREVPADELRAAYVRLLGLDPDYCVNEYGMTELGSQAYDSTLFERVRQGAAGARRKFAPPWMRTRVVHPDTLEPVRAGTPGLLQHVDLANLSSVLVVQTEDLGVATDDGFAVLGRAPGATPRGCSIAMDDLLSSVRHRA